MIWYNYINIGLLLIIWSIIFSDIKKYKIGREFWLLFFAVYTLTEIISVLLEIKHKKNLWLYNISKPIQFFTLTVYFVTLFNLEKKHKYTILLLSLLAYLPFLLFKEISDYNSLFDIIFSSIILIFCIYYFYYIVRSDDDIFLPVSEIWFCISLFIFFGTNLCISGALNFLLKAQLSVARKLFYLLVINSYVFYLLTIYALLAFNKRYLNKYNGR